jgi:hypothetical protein
MSNRNGGPAFPRTPAEMDGWRDGALGMTLRDYFAAQFMARAQSLSEDRDGGWDYNNAAICCYDMADAMLKARNA